MISINVLRIITHHGLIKQQDAHHITHDADKVKELQAQHQFFLKNLKESDLLFSHEVAAQIFDQPSLVFKQATEKEE